VHCKDIERVLEEFVRGNDGIIFEIVLNPTTIAVQLGFKGTSEFDVLIAAGSKLKIESVTELNTKEDHRIIPMVKMEWIGSWSECDIERNPEQLLISLT
jgi:hypothetical protein